MRKLVVAVVAAALATLGMSFAHADASACAPSSVLGAAEPTVEGSGAPSQIGLVFVVANLVDSTALTPVGHDNTVC
jgi:hypothetical protein